MSFGNSITEVYARYFGFKGRAVRSEFWWYVLFLGVIGAVAGFVPVLGAVWFLANLSPMLAVSTRRLQDIDRTGWWQLLPVVALPVLLAGWMFSSQTVLMIGGIAALLAYVPLVIWFTLDGTEGTNRFGKDPKGRIGEDD